MGSTYRYPKQQQGRSTGRSLAQQAHWYLQQVLPWPGRRLRPRERSWSSAERESASFLPVTNTMSGWAFFISTISHPIQTRHSYGEYLLAFHREESNRKMSPISTVVISHLFGNFARLECRKAWWKPTANTARHCSDNTVNNSESCRRHAARLPCI